MKLFYKAIALVIRNRSSSNYLESQNANLVHKLNKVIQCLLGIKRCHFVVNKHRHAVIGKKHLITQILKLLLG